MIGQTISHFHILEKLGEGGMGVVYKAEDANLKRTVAIKFLPRGLEAHEPERARFLQEAQAASAINHPNVCTIYEISQYEGQQFIVMEYVDGKTLRQMVPVQKTQTALDYAIQIGEALQDAHSKGIVHRDIKTDNIMVNTKNQVKVMDFGLAKLKGSLKLTKTSSTVGTLAYMAPEQIEGGEVDARSDIFSFGVVLYEMLTGHLPFRGEHEAAMMYSILNEEPESLQKYLLDAPLELLHVLNRALEKDPRDRYQNVTEMVIDLRRLKKETSRVVRPSEGQFGTLEKPSEGYIEGLLRKKWIRPSAISAGAVVVLVLLYFLVWPSIHSLFFSPKRIQIAVISFENQTGDPQFDYLRTAIPNLLITSLEQSSALRVTTWERMRDLLKQMGKADAQTINTDLGFELCRRDSVKALVTGSFVKMGEMFATDVKVLDVESKQLLKSAGSKGEGVGSILKVQIDELGKQIATGIGLPEAIVATEQKAIANVTTASLEAYNFYLRGVQDLDKFYHKDARRSLEKAIALDSTFAMAHLYLGRACGALGDQQSRRTAYERALKFSGRVTRKEKLFIESASASVLEGDREKEYRILKQLEAEFPQEKEVHYRLGVFGIFGKEDAINQFQQAIALDPTYGLAVNQLAYRYSYEGDYEKALEWFKRYASISPGDANPYDSMGEMYYFMGKLDESIARYKEALEIRPDFDSYFSIAYVYALREEYEEAMKWIEKCPLENRPLVQQFQAHVSRSFNAYWLGSNSRALSTIAAASEVFRQAHNPNYEGGIAILKAVILAEQGDFEGARNLWGSDNKLWNAGFPGYPEYFNAFCRLQQARLSEKQVRTQLVEEALGEASSALQKLTGYFRMWLLLLCHQIQGELLVSNGKIEEAINHLKNPPALPMPSLTVAGFIVYYNLTFPRGGLARAYVQKGDLDSAIAEYERITRFDPASKDRRLIHPLHRYELAKLYEKKGLKEKAIAQYERFLMLWKNADSDRPEPKDARARLARLRRQS
jgi:serine/threonine protein kinase/tetratricopeptide (TPR) repeat protein